MHSRPRLEITITLFPSDSQREPFKLPDFLLTRCLSPPSSHPPPSLTPPLPPPTPLPLPPPLPPPPSDVKSYVTSPWERRHQTTSHLSDNFSLYFSAKL